MGVWRVLFCDSQITVLMEPPTYEGGETKHENHRHAMREEGDVLRQVLKDGFSTKGIFTLKWKRGGKGVRIPDKLPQCPVLRQEQAW